MPQELKKIAKEANNGLNRKEEDNNVYGNDAKQ
jgi:hypothetical protein